MPQVFEHFVREIAPRHGITRSELEAILLALEDHSGAEIAQKLKISEAAVRKRLGEGYRKFEIDGKSNKKLIHLKQKILEEFHSIQPQAPKAEPDWGEAIDVEDFRGRVEQIKELEQWILGRSRGSESPDRARLVAILGLGGIGKTALAARLARSIAPEFDFVIWRSLRNAPPPDDILAELLRFFPNEQGTDLPDNRNTRLLRLINVLQEHRCLVVLDNVESILRSGENEIYHQVGDYKKGFEGYSDLFKKAGETPHKSCLLLTSREKPKEVAALEGKKLSVKVLQLSGVTVEDAKSILEDKGFTCADEQLSELVKRYSGNTLALKIVATTLYDLFGNNVNEFLSQIEQDTAVYGDIRTLLDGQFERLSKLEEQVMYWLAINREYVSLSELKEDIITTESPTRLLEAVESLSRRSLIERDFASGKLRQPFVVMEYITERLIEQFVDEFRNAEFEIFDAYPLIKSRSLDYLRKMQEEQILEPVKNKLLSTYDKELETHLRRALDRLRDQSSPRKGYAAGNLINLMRQLQIDQPQINLSGRDFSDLTIRQAYLKDVKLTNTKFINTDLTDSVFSETLASLVSVRFSPDGKHFATGVGDGEIHLWQVSDNKQIRIYKGHTAWVWTVVFSPDGKLLASGSGDHTVKLWNVETGECVHSLTEHTNTVSSVSFRNDGQILASASEDQTIKLWDVETGECLKTLTGHDGWVWALNFSPREPSLLASGSADGTVKLWECDRGICLKTLNDHTSQVYSVAFSPNGKILASSSEDQTIKLWNVQTGECFNTLTGHSKKIHSVRFSPDGRSLASSGEDRTVKIWDVETGKRLQNLKGHMSQVWSIAFSPDGQTLLSSSDDQTARLWDVKKGKLLNVLRGSTRGIYAVAFAPVFESAPDYPSGELQSIALGSYKANRPILASGNDDHVVRLWNLQTHECHDLRGHTGRIRSVSFSPCEPILASSSADCTIKLWDIDQRECLQTLNGHTNWVWTVRFSPDGQTLVSSSEDRTIRLWDRHTGDCLNIFKGHTHWVWSVAFNPAGDRLASGSADSKVMVWNVNTGKCIQVLDDHKDLVWSVAFSPNQPILASGSEDQTIKLWDAQTGTCLRTLAGHEQQIYCVAFSPDGRSLVSGSGDETLKLWSVETGECLDTLRRGHTAPIRAVTFSADGQTIVSGSEDETIQLWDVQKGIRRESLKSARLYEGMDITGISGLTEAQQASLKALGAVDKFSVSR